MFIYSIDVGGKKYIGLDSKPVRYEYRWKEHQRNFKRGNRSNKLYKALEKHGVDSAIYSVIDDGDFKNIIELAITEIYYIKLYDTYKNGLNSTYGGDGMGHHLHTMSSDEIKVIKENLSKTFLDFNNKRWNETTEEERKNMTAHLHTDAVYQSKSQTLKKFYIDNPNARKEKGEAIKRWQKENHDTLVKQNTRNGRKGAEKLAHRVRVITPDGDELIYSSKKEFCRNHGFIINLILEKTLKGETHKGWRGWID